LPIALLDDMPLHSFKVDQRLVAGLEAGEGHERLRRLVRIAAAFGRPAIAVGVEAARLRPVLAELGFQFAQGFCLQVPVGSAEAAGVAARVL
jgi:EAL domain-containing protein (putative c-di-GMP-specific phosphodiesterase class I)